MDTIAQDTEGMLTKLDSVLDRLQKLETKSTAARWWDAAMKFAVPLVIGAGSMAVGHEIRLTRIESTRFTKDDGAALLEKVRQENQVPAWLKDSLAEIKTGIRDLDARTRNIERVMK